MEYRTAYQSDLPKIIDLVNAVFCRANDKPETMGEQFPLMFDENNLDHLWVASENHNIISHIGGYTAPILIDGVMVKGASIGAVATDLNYRKRGLSTILLKKAFSDLREEGIDLVFVSGDRGLYFRNGCYQVGKMNRLVFSSSEKTEGTPKSSSYHLRRVDVDGGLSDETAQVMVGLERNEQTRFVRSHDKLKELYQAAGYCRIFPWRQEAYIVESAGKAQAYFVIGVEEVEIGNGKAHIIEFHGDREAVAQGILSIEEQLGTEQVIVPLLEYEHQLHRLLIDNGFELVQEAPFPGTIRLLNPVGLLEQFADRLIGNHKGHLCVNEDEENGLFSIYIDDDLYWKGSEEEVAQWLFSRLPLPWPNGLNFI